MESKYNIVNIWDLLDEKSEAFIGEEALKDILSDFSCKPNPDAEYFLSHNVFALFVKSS